MGGGLMQLVAYGAQDIYLTGNPQITFFKVVYRRHTNFAVEAIEQTFTGSVDFGRKISCIIDRNGDLLHKMYLEIDINVDEQTGSNAVNNKHAKGGELSNDCNFATRLGHAMIKEVSIEIGGQCIDTHYGEWLELWSQLTMSCEQLSKHRRLIDGNITNSDCSSVNNSRKLYIPLQFWFNRNPGLALPLIALQYHEVKINVILESSAQSGFNNNSFPKIQQICLFCDYIFLDTDERKRFAQISHEYLIEQLQFNNITSVDSEEACVNVELRFNHPCKELIWTVQPQVPGCTSSGCDQGRVHPFDWSREITQSQATTLKLIADNPNIFIKQKYNVKYLVCDLPSTPTVDDYANNYTIGYFKDLPVFKEGFMTPPVYDFVSLTSMTDGLDWGPLNNKGLILEVNISGGGGGTIYIKQTAMQGCRLFTQDLQGGGSGGPGNWVTQQAYTTDDCQGSGDGQSSGDGQGSGIDTFKVVDELTDGYYSIVLQADHDYKLHFQYVKGVDVNNIVSDATFGWKTDLTSEYNTNWASIISTKPNVTGNELVMLNKELNNNDSHIQTLNVGNGSSQQLGSALDNVLKAKLQLNGHDRFREREGTYFRCVQPFQHHTGGTLQGWNNDKSRGSVDNGFFYVYSFALKPEEHQPSGTCNFSRIDNAVLQMSLAVTDNDKKYAKFIRVYATNYNVLRIMSGMGGLAYSN